MGETIIQDLQRALPPAAASMGPNGSDSDGGVSFRDVLSALNPLQYLPVVGTIYRALTGDQIAEPLRYIGSMVASALMGGPVGVLINAATTMFQRAIGIDFDEVAQGLLTGAAPHDGAASPPERISAPAVVTAPAIVPAPSDPGQYRAATAAYTRTLSFDRLGSGRG